MNILLIEDTISHSDLITDILIKNNHNVKLISDGSIAYNYLLKPEVYPDVVIIDNFLPAMTGLEIIEYFINSNYDYAFVMLTSGQSINLAVKGMKIGALEYVSKSLRIKDELQFIIEKAFQTNQEKILRKTLQKNLEESEKSLKQQYQNLPVPTYTWKKAEDDFTLIDYNLAAIEISKGGIEKYTGTKLKEMFSDYPKIIDKIENCYKTHKNQITENYYTFRMSKIKRYLKSTYVYVPSDMVMVHTEDITNRKKAEQALMESEGQLRELNAEKDKFFSIIAHDLKTPFSTMLGFSQLLINNFDKYDVQKQKKFLGILNQDMNNTYKLLENLLMWSRSQSGSIDFDPQKENLYLLSVETINLLNQSASNKSITLINQIPVDVYVEADKNMLLIILRNLISNAIKFTPKGGEITIKAHLITDENKQNYAEISVKDSGVGIAKEKLIRLFKISENVSAKGTENETGTGLGLILCKEFVEKHGGKIRVESEVGKGSKFIFTFTLLKS